MPRKSDKRERLVEAAKKLMFQQGFNVTTLADIAQEADVPLGNVYYYFKTKESIGEAVITHCMTELSTRLNECNTESNAVDRLCKYLDQELQNQEWTLQYGDNTGTLAQELAKDSASSLDNTCAKLMTQSVAWMQQQFQEAGCDEASAKHKAHELMASLQGVNLLALTLKDRSTHTNLCNWLKNRVRSSVGSSHTSANTVSHHSVVEDNVVEAFA